MTSLKEQLRGAERKETRNKEVLQVFSEQYLIEPKSIQSPQSGVRLGTAPYADNTSTVR